MGQLDVHLCQQLMCLLLLEEQGLDPRVEGVFLLGAFLLLGLEAGDFRG
jgi:hypothetical protein